MTQLAAPAPAAPRSVSDLIAVLRDKAPWLAVSLAAGQTAWPAVSWLRGKARDRATYTVKVPGSDDIYDDLHEWVLSLLPSRDQRALVAWSSKRGTMLCAPGEHPGAPEPAALRLRYDGAREQAIMVAGHKVKVIVADAVAGKDDSSYWKPPEIVFTMASSAARQALLNEVGGVLRRSQSAQRKPAFRMLDKWGDWDRLDELPPRELDSVILPAGQLKRLTDDIGRFLASEQDYLRRSIPWHRGHLYEGPPGTGKTSVARALASHFGMDVWYLPLADVKNDASLLRLASRVSPRSMLLLEDVDVFHAATQRDDNADVTLSGLLNTLDGIATPHGLLTVLTTNSPDVLDDAVVRAGRIDLTEHFGLAGEDQVRLLISRWYERSAVVPADIPAITGLAPAEVIEACKRHDDPAMAIAHLAGRRMLTPLAN